MPTSPFGRRELHLQALPLVFVLAGLALYTVLGGADFGTGWWQLAAGSGSLGERTREHARHAIAPVWEANHVWLVFCLTVTWTAYPLVFGSIASTLSIPLFVAALGIILRGTTYALRAGAITDHRVRSIDMVFALSSILTPFALGAAVGGIASRRVPVGNAAGNLVTSWLNPTSLLIGTVATAFAAYVSAVFLSADAARIGDAELEAVFRRRALAAGLVAGALALGGLAVVHHDARPLFHGLVDGRGRAALAASVAAGIATLALVARRRYELARYSAALAVGAIVVGWGLAQAPVMLPGLTVSQAAATHDTLVAVVVAVLAGAVVLLPALAVLFRLALRGTFDEGAVASGVTLGSKPEVVAPVPAALGRLAGASLVAGIGFTTVAQASWAHAVGVACLLGAVVLAFPVVLPER